jgi:hypothetical protein
VARCSRACCSTQWSGAACRPTRSRSRASPPKQFRPAVQAIPPSLIEIMRARLLADGKLRDATLLVVLAYANNLESRPSMFKVSY